MDQADDVSPVSRELAAHHERNVFTCLDAQPIAVPHDGHLPSVLAGSLRHLKQKTEPHKIA